MGDYWRSERLDFAEFRSHFQGGDYRDWQPTKWQSLSGLRQAVVDHTTAAGRPIRTALELGCGSATLLIQFALDGVLAEGIDRDEDALGLAADAAASLSSPAERTDHIRFRLGDFLQKRLSPLSKADLVFSIGVIEHFDLPEQRRVLRLHGEASHRWVLIAVPNLESPLFQTFLSSRTRQGRLYEDEHQPIDVQDLAEDCGYRLAKSDGCHLFLSRRSDRDEVGDELAAFDKVIRERLLERNPVRFAEFPDMDLSSSDIEALGAVENAVGPEVRWQFGFLRWYLLDCGV